MDISVSQAAKILGVTRQYVNQYVKAGTLKARKVVGRYVIKREEVLALKEQRARIKRGNERLSPKKVVK